MVVALAAPCTLLTAGNRVGNELWGLQKGVRSSRVPSRRLGRYCIRLSWVFASAVSWLMQRVVRRWLG